VFRYAFLFPLRLLGLLSWFAVFFAMFFSVKAAMPAGRTKLAVEQRLIRFMCGESGRRSWGAWLCAASLPAKQNTQTPASTVDS
jgi:hypothetical protein